MQTSRANKLHNYLVQFICEIPLSGWGDIYWMWYFHEIQNSSVCDSASALLVCILSWDRRARLISFFLLPSRNPINLLLKAPAPSVQVGSCKIDNLLSVWIVAGCSFCISVAFMWTVCQGTSILHMRWEHVTLKKVIVEPSLTAPYSILVCLAKSSAESIGESILSTVRKAARLAV